MFPSVSVNTCWILTPTKVKTRCVSVIRSISKVNVETRAHLGLFGSSVVVIVWRVFAVAFGFQFVHAFARQTTWLPVNKKVRFIFESNFITWMTRYLTKAQQWPFGSIWSIGLISSNFSSPQSDSRVHCVCQGVGLVILGKCQLLLQRTYCSRVLSNRRGDV